MVSKVSKKAILDIKKNIDSYGKEMAAIEEKIATIDEKYRKLMEKETKELRQAYAELEQEQEIWNTSLSRYDADVVNEVLGNSPATEDENAEEQTVDITTGELAPVEEKVVDTIFEENNEKTEETVEETESEEESVESTEEPAFAQNDEVPEQLEAVAEGSADWNEASEEEAVPATPSSEEEWPELPEDWK